MLQDTDAASPAFRASRLAQLWLSASQAWLRDHASPYRGQWVMVRGGVLLGASADLAALRDLIARENDPATTIITRVL
ncbi:MAG: hypothetical protein HGA45_30755 [Chloroflexales bacterium]|nr:hypothetical protein [Chloroflexales bacterium]